MVTSSLLGSTCSVVKRIGVVGYGHWGPNLIRNFLKTDGLRAVTCCEANECRRRLALATFPQIHAVEDFDSLLYDPDVAAIVIATPAFSHYELAKKALRAGKHVLVEKPMTLQVSHAEELVALARAFRLILMVDHTYTYEPAVWTLRHAITSGAIGSPLSLESTRGNNGPFHQDVNVVWDLAPHDVSIIDYLLDRQPDQVSARAEAIIDGKEAQATLLLHFAASFTAEIRCSWLLKTKTRIVNVRGTKGNIKYDDLCLPQKLEFHSAITETIVREKASPEVPLLPAHGSCKNGRYYEPLAALTAEFIRCILEGRQPHSDGEAGLRVVRILAALQRSLNAQGATLPV